jgi:hypothetical protein
MPIKTVREIIGVPITKGDIGIEIEVEGIRLPTMLDPKVWRIDADGSLKGPENREYVMPMPASLKDAFNALDYLAMAYKENHSIVNDSIRAGVHIHRNVQDLTLKQLFTFIVAYFTLEKVLVQWCGDSREGNLFCLRGTEDAEFILFELMKAIEKRKLGGLKTDNLRYCSLNVCALFKYGSIEFRAMRGTSNLEEIKTWAATIDELYDNSLKFTDPTEIVLSVCSGGGEPALLKRLLPTQWSNFTHKGYTSQIRDGARAVQMLAFSTDWNSYDRPSKNPFNEEWGNLAEPPALTEPAPTTLTVGTGWLDPFEAVTDTWNPEDDDA